MFLLIAFGGLQDSIERSRHNVMTALNVRAKSLESSCVLLFNLSPADERLSNCYILLFVSRTFDDPKAMPLSEDKVIRRENEGREVVGEDGGLVFWLADFSPSTYTLIIFIDSSVGVGSRWKWRFKCAVSMLLCLRWLIMIIKQGDNGSGLMGKPLVSCWMFSHAENMLYASTAKYIIIISRMYNHFIIHFFVIVLIYY